MDVASHDKPGDGPEQLRRQRPKPPGKRVVAQRGGGQRRGHVESVQVREGLEELWADPHGAVVMLAVGAKGSGKTHFCQRMLRMALETGKIDKLVVVAPVFRFESSGSYKWMTDPKWEKPAKDSPFPGQRVLVCERYSPSLIQKILHRRDPDRPGGEPKEASRMCLWIDDLSAAADDILFGDAGFTELIAIARHLRVSVVLCHHAVTGARVLPPFLRQNLSHCLVSRIASRKLLDCIYEEWVSLLPHWKSSREFVAWHSELTKAGPGSGIVIDIGGKHPQTVASDIKDWWSEWAPDKHNDHGAGKAATTVRRVVDEPKDAAPHSKRQRSVINAIVT